jgi:hypothetical protein
MLHAGIRCPRIPYPASFPTVSQWNQQHTERGCCGPSALQPFLAPRKSGWASAMVFHFDALYEAARPLYDGVLRGRAPLKLILPGNINSHSGGACPGRTPTRIHIPGLPLPSMGWFRLQLVNVLSTSKLDAHTLPPTTPVFPTTYQLSTFFLPTSQLFFSLILKHLRYLPLTSVASSV